MTTHPSIELRSFVDEIEFRGASDGRIVAAGVAMKYGAKSKPIPHKARGVFREEFRSGAFSKTVQETDVEAHLEHAGPYLARVSNGTLRLVDGRSELGYEIDLPDTTAGRDAATLLERRDVRGSSIGFRSLPGHDAWTVDDDGMALRTVTEARLFRVDLTTSPAYTDSTAEFALRSLAADLELELDQVLEAAGAGELRSLIDPPSGGDGETDSEDAGRETLTVVRPRILSLYA